MPKSIYFALLLGLVILSGCRRSRAVVPVVPEKAPVETSIVILGDDDLNSGGRVAVVYLYQLGGQSGLKEASLETFWQNDRQALGADLVRREELRLYPGDRVSRSFVAESATRYIGIAVNLADPVPEGWRLVVPLEADDPGPIVFRIGSNRLVQVQ